jgi:hypothetical protein
MNTDETLNSLDELFKSSLNLVDNFEEGRISENFFLRKIREKLQELKQIYDEIK